MRSEKRCKTQKPLIKSYGCAFFWDVLTNEKKDGFVFSSRPTHKKRKFFKNKTAGVFKRTGALRVLSHNPGMAFSQSFNIRLTSFLFFMVSPNFLFFPSRTLKQPMPVCPWADSFPSGLKGYTEEKKNRTGKIRFVCYSICRAAALQGFMISSAIDLEASFVERICMTSYPNFFST